VAAIYTFKIRGLTSGSATIATVDCTIDEDGMLRYTDSDGNPRSVKIAGDFAQLMKDIFTGGGGVDSGFVFMV
jgi:hypothetical protein